MPHKLPSSFLGRERLKIAVVGVGGTGSEVLTGLTHLHLALRALDHAGLHITAFDPDEVSHANLVRQRYHHSDLGRNKAEVLVTRVNLACNLDWVAVPLKFSGHRARAPWDLVISCVDSRAARRSLHLAAYGKGMYTWRYWLDCGNDLTTGQVVLGTPREAGKRLKHHLPCATELHPELMDTAVPEDDAPSCSAIEALSRQDLFVGRMVATHALDLLWQLFRHGELTHHARYFELRGAALSSRGC
ncbi:UBA/THIF-type NAD/FAD binding protein [Deinococcus aerius]|uniref:UBA/THIF-type NAD/FAD binding protein n=3 Tax=Deinococcus TaxID=1298 RepID=A0A2I9CSF0_9DEIO|nr:PRTRC system ThiF family protein [Deinococcus aerius]QBY07511.1 PRTRC system ThiF family protein [Deinococcus metallilatus]RXJ14904.1 PRTRC system ThiF family protein [Deinococcus metallilatus]TLK31025.1 PRTRC system ThiF family protein [Deinococcus metallilatus]GBF04559.1 UBA/THIF-type NAD/FAD binding protein [Deinococcus aerius]GMA17913.1 thiazole biosynthesis adenylyltransferase ThiF [Deinococcus metallilatus]